MANHSTNPRAPSAPRAARVLLRLLAGIASAAALVVALAACGAVGALAGATSTPAGGGAAATAGTKAGTAAVALPVDQAGVCIDGTSSSAAHYATDFKAQVAAAVSGWVAAPPASPSAGVPGQPGLHLVLRSVTTQSYSTDDKSVHETIPAVPAIAPQPTPTRSDYNDALRSWLDGKPAWERKANAAVAQARKVAGEVRGYRVARHTYSGIWSCLSGAASELGDVQGGRMRLVVLSDMENNEAIVGLSLARAHVLLVTVCPSHASTGCPRRFAKARSLLLKHGASSVREISADAVTPQDLASFWRS